MTRRRRVDPQKAREAAVGIGWYLRIPEPETTWEECSACGTRARILDAENKECIRCRVERSKRTREGSTVPEPSGPF